MSLKQLRIINKYSQYDLAKAIDVSQAHISRWENYKCSIPYDYLIKLTDILNCSIEDISGKDDFSLKNIIQINNNCINCAHCVKHYANIRGTFYSLGEMHCINAKMSTSAQKQRIKNLALCDFWQPKQIQISNRRESIKETLKQMARQIDEISQILQEEGSADSWHKKKPQLRRTLSLACS